MMVTEYDKDVPLKDLQAKFKQAFDSDALQLDKRVVYVHGVPADFKLPSSVAGNVMSYDAHTTLPIAVLERLNWHINFYRTEI